MIEEFNLGEYADLICEVIDSGGVFRMYPKGTSMLPLIRQKKDSVELAKPDFPLKKGEIIFYKRDNGQYVLHRIVGKNQDGYILCGDNQVTLEPGIRQDQIVAVVETIYRNNKPVKKNNLRYRLYLLIWRFFIIRRIVWKLKR